MSDFFESVLSQYLSDCMRGHSCQNVVLRLVENCGSVLLPRVKKISRTYDLSSSYIASIIAHREVNYVKREADNPSVFLLMVKIVKYLEAFTYILKIFSNLWNPHIIFNISENLTYLM